MNRYFVFSGPIGSGKSSISKLFATTIGGGWSGFGTSVKEIAVERHVPIDRDNLQRLGASLVDNERLSFCRRVIDKAKESKRRILVIDGLRHVEVLALMRSLVGADQLYCIFVDTPQVIRLERVRIRDGVSAEKLAELEQHSTEIEVMNRLKHMANFVCDNSGSVEKCVEAIAAWAKELV